MLNAWFPNELMKKIIDKIIFLCYYQHKRKNDMDNAQQYDKLENLPSLKKGWVRLVHRCIYKNNVNSIKKNGLVFNKNAAQLSSWQKGGSYSDIASMASVYNEASFWKSMCHDNFSCYDNARYADTKIVFDMPIDEFCLLKKYGRLIKGTIDSKYIVGCIPNINGENKNLTLPEEKIMHAANKSQNNPPSSAQPNNIDNIVEELLLKCKSDKKEELRAIVYEGIKHCREDLQFELYEPKTTQNKKAIPLTTMLQNHCR